MKEMMKNLGRYVRKKKAGMLRKRKSARGIG
jgi:hypothetical protein